MASDRPVVREWGPADGRPLVFWPGLNPWGGLQLIEVGPLLAERGLHVLSVEAPWDLAQPDHYLPSRLAELVLDVAPERFAFMGHSWGGSVGVQLAADHPERVDALVLLDGGYRDIDLGGASLTQVVEHFESEQTKHVFDDWAAFVEHTKSRVREWRPAVEEMYRSGWLERDGKIVPRSSARAAAWAIHGIAAEKQTGTHDRLQLPILLLLAHDADPGAFADKPNVETHRLDAGHDIAEDAPEETARLVGDWLSRVADRLPPDG